MEAQLDESRKCTASFPYITTSCITLIVLNLLTFPVEAMWKRMFPQFESLPKHMRRHDVNLLIRIIVPIPVSGLTIYVIFNTFQDIEWYLANREFVSGIVLAYLIFDLFELSQRRKVSKAIRSKLLQGNT